MFVKLNTFIILLLFFSSCNWKEDRIWHDVGLLYRISVPESLQPDSTLNDEASLALSSYDKGLWLMVIDEPKEDGDSIDLFIYDQWAYGNFRELFDGKATTKGPIDVNGTTMIVHSLTGKYLAGDNKDLYLLFAIVEGKRGYYQLMLWTDLNKKEDLAQEMEQILSSFTELPSQ